MTDMNQIKDTLNLEQKDMQKLPGMLNVLTILTYIGCGLGLILSLYSYFTIGASAKAMEMLGDLDTGGSSAASKLMGGAMEMVKKQYENRHLILILTLVAIALCFYGAMQMRNQKKMGFYIYTVGELLPLLTTLLFVGGGALGGFAMFLGAIIPVLFIILYATQLKHLK
jgi:hypothetical protein